MNHILTLIAIPLSIIIAIIFVIKLRRSNQNIEEKLTSTEKIIFTLAMLSTGLSVLYYVLLGDINIGQLKASVIVLWLPQTIIVGSILYYGLKKHSPSKARQILFIERVVLGIILLLMIGGHFFINYYLLPKWQAEFETIEDQRREEHKLLKEQEGLQIKENLISNKRQKYVGSDFSIDFPIDWIQEDLSPVFNSNPEKLRFIEWETVPVSYLYLMEGSLEISDDEMSEKYKNYSTKTSDYFLVEHPIIKNSSKTLLLYTDSSTFYRIRLLVQKNNKLYNFQTTLMFEPKFKPTKQEKEALKNIVLSFELTD